MAVLGKHFISSKVDGLLARMGKVSPPTDLWLAARLQGVLAVAIQPILAEGGIKVLPNGFKILLNGKRPCSVDIQASSIPATEVIWPTLTRRQRFSFAHEITHSLFFDTSTVPPKIMKGMPRKGRLLEYYCHLGARRILLPSSLVIHTLKKHGTISSDLVLDLCDSFSVSAETAIRRLNDIGGESFSGRSVLLAELDDSGADARILSLCWNTSLLVHFKEPELHSSLKEWLGTLAEVDFLAAHTVEKVVTRRSGSFRLRKIPYPNRLRQFFIEIDCNIP